MEYVFDYNDRSATLFVGLLIRILVLLALKKFAHTNAYAKLLAAVGALEYQRLTSLVLGLVEGDVLVALGAAYSFHYLQSSLYL